MKTRYTVHTTIGLTVVLLSILAGGCASTAKAPPKKFVFFPGAPDPPRVQFLASYNSEKELRGPDSAFAFYLTGETPKENPIGKPYGVAFHNHKIFLCDSAEHGVLVLDFDKHQMTALATEGESALSAPMNIAIDGEGNQYVVDVQREQVLCLDPTTQLKWVLGKRGEMKPSDVALDGDRIYVTDVRGHNIRVYVKTDQSLLFTIPRGNDLTNKDALLVTPSNVAVDSRGQIYASDSVAGRISIYDKDGKFLRNLSGMGDDPNSGLLKRPKGIAVDRSGIVYVVDAAYQLVQMFDDQGHYLMCFGYPGSSQAAGMTLPAKVIVDYDDVNLFQKEAAPGFKIDYLLVVTNQFGPRKVAIYGFGHKK